MEKKPELIEGKYYWVKVYPYGLFEPAKCTDRYGNEELFFELTDGSIWHNSVVTKYKELINPFNN